MVEPAVDRSGVDRSSASEPSKYLLLRAGDRFFAVPILEVREVLPPQEYVRLPGAHPAVCGLVSVRSRVLTVLDLGAALGLGRSCSSPGHRVVVLERDGCVAGLAVNGVGEIKTGSHEYTVIHVPELLAEWFG